MKLLSNIILLLFSAIIISSCDKENTFDTEEINYVYTTPQVGEEYIYITATKSGSFNGKNIKYDELLLDNLDIHFTNISTGEKVTTFEKYGISDINDQVNTNIKLYRGEVDQDYFKSGHEINLNISQENETIVDETVTVPEKPEIVISNLDLVPNEYIDGRGFPINEVVELNITVKKSPHKYFRLGMYEKDRRTGQWVKSPTALQKQDEAFFNNTIKDIEPTDNNPIKRYTSDSFHNWIYANQSDTEDDIILTAHFWNPDLITSYRLVLTPLPKDIFQVELNAIIDNDVTDIYGTPSPYPDDIAEENTIGNFAILNPLVVEK